MASREKMSLDASKIDRLTLASGSPKPNKHNSLTVGLKGPQVLQDVAFVEEIAHFDRERIPERVVHAKGAVALGTFKVTNSDVYKEYCAADFLCEKGKKTPVAVRFSQVAAETGASDTLRDIRGFAIKFYTLQGNFDLVGNNLPVFFVRDPIKFVSLIHSQKRNPKTNLKDPNAFWDFVALNPETMHAITMLFTDRGVPDGFRHMQGFGVNTFKLINKNSQVYFAKFHLICQQKIRSLDAKIAQKIAGIDADYALKDLLKAIDDKKAPSWQLKIQVMSERDATRQSFNPFDATKTWPHKEFPLIEVGKLTLDQNVDNFFAQNEQLAFCPANLVPGIQPACQDKLLTGRMFSYADTQRYRLGVNYQKMPVNKPNANCPLVTPTYRDGITFDDNYGSLPNYVTASAFVKLKLSNDQDKVQSQLTEFPEHFDGVLQRYDDDDDDNFSQAAVLYNKVLKSDIQAVLATNLAESLGVVTNEKTVEKVLGHLEKVSEQLAKETRKALKSQVKKKK